MNTVAARSAALFLVLCASAASAQEGDLLIDRGRADRRAPSNELRTPSQRAPAPVAEPAREITPFVLNSVRVDGSSLPQAAFTTATAPLIGQRFEGATLRRLSDTIARVYAESDIALYSIAIPEQDFSNGAVRLIATEGRLADVTLQGEGANDALLVRRYAAPLTAEQPLRRRTLERQLSLISDIPGLETEVRMAPTDQPGAARMDLHMKRTPWRYGFGIANNGASALGQTQLQAVITRNALFGLGDQTQLTLMTDTAFERLFYAALGHRQPIGHDGASISGQLSALETRPRNGVDGQARGFGLAYSNPLIRSYNRNVTFSLGFDGLNSENAVLGNVIASERTRVVRASLASNDNRERRSWRWGATLSQGLDSLGARTTAPIAADFTKANLQLGYNRALGEHFVVRLAAAGQASGEALPASERFTLGGSFGRAFETASLSGDEGAAASAELGYRRRGVLSEVYGFADGGRIWSATALSRDLASAGIGARFSFGKTGLDLEAAKPIETPFTSNAWRLRFAISSRF